MRLGEGGGGGACVMWLYIHLHHWRVTKGSLCVNKQHSSKHLGPRHCSREIFQGEQTGLMQSVSIQGDLWKPTLYWQQKAWQDRALPREVTLSVSSPWRALLLSSNRPLHARSYSAHIILQINGINYLFHKHTLLVHVLLRFLKFKHLAQECNLSTLPFKSP